MLEELDNQVHKDKIEDLFSFSYNNKIIQLTENNRYLHLLSNSKLPSFVFSLCLLLLQMCRPFCISCYGYIPQHFLHCLVICIIDRLCIQ